MSNTSAVSHTQIDVVTGSAWQPTAAHTAWSALRPAAPLGSAALRNMTAGGDSGASLDGGMMTRFTRVDGGDGQALSRPVGETPQMRRPSFLE